MQKEQNPLILTLRLDPVSQAFFDELRARYFPPECNYLKAHLTLFHQLPQVAATYGHLAQVRQVPFRLEVSGLKSLGAGVAYTIAGAVVFHLRESLAAYFRPVLIPRICRFSSAHHYSKQGAAWGGEGIIGRIEPWFSAFRDHCRRAGPLGIPGRTLAA